MTTPAPLAGPSTEVLSGLVERVTFHSPESGFCVLRVKARGHRDLVTVVGHTAMVSAGEWVTASGEWTNDAAHGVQFRARFLKTSEPTSEEGIGPVYAKRLVQIFGTEVFDVMEAAPKWTCLVEVESSSVKDEVLHARTEEAFYPRVP